MGKLSRDARSYEVIYDQCSRILAEEVVEIWNQGAHGGQRELLCLTDEYSRK